MKTVTFTEFRKHASGLFSDVEGGENLLVLRHGLEAKGFPGVAGGGIGGGCGGGGHLRLQKWNHNPAIWWRPAGFQGAVSYGAETGAAARKARRTSSRRFSSSQGLVKYFQMAPRLMASVTVLISE